jgi:hypothetical protein
MGNAQALSCPEAKKADLTEEIRAAERGIAEWRADISALKRARPSWTPNHVISAMLSGLNGEGGSTARSRSG